MGVPVSGKNLFPSNIAGLPTWYTIRANKNGYIAGKKEVDFVVAMNPETAVEDVKCWRRGRCSLRRTVETECSADRSYFLRRSFDKITATVCPEAKLRKLVKNMVYVGVVAHLLGLDLGETEKAIRKQFGKKQKAADLNVNAVKAGYDYAVANIERWTLIGSSGWTRTRGRSSLMAIRRLLWAACLQALPWLPGTRLHRPPRWWNPSLIT